MSEFQPGGLLELLHRHNVKFILIGGMAGAVHGSPDITQDLDICYARDADNLARLAEALKEVNAYLRGAPPNLPFVLDARSLKMGDHFTFVSDLGDFDCLATPAGTGGYGDLARGAETVTYRDFEIRVASIPDLMRMKRASGRSKDLLHLETLEAIQEETQKSDP